jgi:hypothetical protein
MPDTTSTLSTRAAIAETINNLYDERHLKLRR